MFKNFMKLLFIGVVAIPLLGSCSLFQPDTKVIEYDEEVKLHDGSMIWVHIKRHYRWSGWAPGGGGVYQASITEISWDTGFPNVGRKSVFFNDMIYFIDKYDGVWYVGGKRYPYKKTRFDTESINCSVFGDLVRNDERPFNVGCILSINPQGKLGGIDLDKYKEIKLNILYGYDSTTTEKNAYPPILFHNKSLNWDKKMEIETKQPIGFKVINKTYKPYKLKGDIINE